MMNLRDQIAERRHEQMAEICVDTPEHWQEALHAPTPRREKAFAEEVCYEVWQPTATKPHLRYQSASSPRIPGVVYMTEEEFFRRHP